MSHLKVFSSEEFGDINVVLINQKEYFEAMSIARALGYSNPRDAILRHCQIEGVVFHDTRVVTGKKADGSKATKYITRKYINEGNLYRLILKSKLPSAKRFESWIVDEVLPSIRKHGVYMDDKRVEETLNNPDFIIQMATKLKEERKLKIAEGKRADKLQAIISLDEPYTSFAKQIEVSDGSITIGQFAKLLNNNNIKIGRNRLFRWFRDNGYFIKSGKEKNMPKQAYIEQGLFRICERISITTLITGKGQIYFSKRIFDIVEDDFLEEFYQ